MPHDRDGSLLEPGDRVTMEFVVKAVFAGEDFCNINMDSVEPLHPNTDKTHLGAVNSRQVVKVQG